MNLYTHLKFGRPCAVGLLSWLAACASAPEFDQSRAPAEGFALTARLAVRTGAEGFTGGLRWVHAPRAQRLSISSPLGQIVAEIEWDQAEATLRLPDRQVHAPDLSLLMEREMGWALPIEGLSDWVQGRPRPGQAFEADRNALGRLEALRQDGWSIEYPAYFEDSDAKGKPRRLVLRHGETELRLVIDRWASSENR